MRKLGRIQEEVLLILNRREHWFAQCGWHWGGYNETARLCESLVKRGYVAKTNKTFVWKDSPTGSIVREVYAITDTGKTKAKEIISDRRAALETKNN